VIWFIVVIKLVEPVLRNCWTYLVLLWGDHSSRLWVSGRSYIFHTMWGSNGRKKVVLALEDLGLGIMRQVPSGSWKVERMVRRSLFQLKSLDGKILSGGGKPWRHAASNMIVAPLNEAPPYSMGYLVRDFYIIRKS